MKGKLAGFGWMAMLSLPLCTAEAAKEPAYACYARLLDGHVCAKGVDYPGLKRSGLVDSCHSDFALSRKSYLSLSEAGRMAYLINLYNFYTLKLIVDNYPLKSIRELERPWKREFVPLFGRMVSLDHIEHGMLRKDFEEPRIHFAVNCASVGCPALRPDPFEGGRLERQLGEAAKEFLFDRSRNRLEGDVLHLSKIFDWYGGDFDGRYGGFLPFAQQALGIEGKVEYKFLPYDWGLNDGRECGK